MQAQDVMTRSVITVTANTAVTDIARQLIARRISAVPVVDGAGKIIGIVSEGDLMRRDESDTGRKRSWWLSLVDSPGDKAADYVKSHGRDAGDVMTRDVLTVSEETELGEIAALLEKNHIKRVPVLRDDKPVGIVSRANLLHGLASAKPAPAISADDGTIRAALIDAFGDAGINQVFVNAVVADGTVHIWGEVNSEAEVKALKVAAGGVGGVKKVVNNVTVMTAQMRAMTWE
jgi:CBS domain-containing protein